MVKRKADISLDKWLERGIAVPETAQPDILAAIEEPVNTNCLTAEAASIPLPTESVITPSVEPGDQSEAAVEWFRSLLELAGYERV